MKTMNETTESIKSMGGQASEALSRVAGAAKTEYLDPASEAVKDAMHRSEAYARKQGDNLAEWVNRQPLAALGAAFGLGVLVTLCVRLKHHSS